MSATLRLRVSLSVCVSARGESSDPIKVGPKPLLTTGRGHQWTKNTTET